MGDSHPPRPIPRRLKVLFVCTLNQWRSPTAENLYRGDPRLEVRSAGVRRGARRHLGTADVSWADAILVMEADHKQWIQENFRNQKLPPIRVLKIANNLGYMDEDLQRILRQAIDPEIEALLGPESPSPGVA